MNLKKAGCILHVGSVDAYFLSTYTETGSDALYNWQCCSCQAVLALLICLGTYGHKHLTYHHHHEIFPFKRVYWLILLLPVQSFLFFLGFWSLIKRIGSNSDRVSFLFPSFFSTFHEEHHVVHCFVTSIHSTCSDESVILVFKPKLIQDHGKIPNSLSCWAS